jgi:hypothetical protein
MVFYHLVRDNFFSSGHFNTNNLFPCEDCGLPIKTGFGWIKIGNVTYEHDVVIHTDGRVTKRQKNRSRDLKEIYGHTPLSENELDLLKEENPDVVYIGIGQYGSLPLTPGANELLLNYHTIILPTPDLVLKIGHEEHKYFAIIHITC